MGWRTKVGVSKRNNHEIAEFLNRLVVDGVVNAYAVELRKKTDYGQR